MKTVKRFNSFEALKASERSSEETRIVLSRHSAFEELLLFIRSKIKRKNRKSVR